MKTKLTLMALIALFLASPALADETASFLRLSETGNNFIISTPSPATIQNVDAITAVKDTTFAINLPGDGGGSVFTFTWVNESASADTLWKFYPSRAAATDSTWFLCEPGVSTFNIIVAGSDSMRVDKTSSSGQSYGYLGGVN